MKHELTFDFECGETRCGTAPGQFCRFYQWQVNGKAYCFFFGEVFDDDDGWSQRHPECLKQAQAKEGTKTREQREDARNR